ncbi:TlpA disulfide reductase family protein [Marinospirillum alkaliphilum]|uniref:Thiol-disulfide isomerase or thioredoxin n=1 Tax=Marinospirillum alkaliphilum DSM 21637 TaxID=1122209 RepID=A0A1K1WMP9_9GAMM|nr:TlpA disulfide reductase family protein [Marinospirillum alkaliphilum]SFX38061.1 Thiol-disulfide isomerase or thioredoxin [Marinospirillum alkaliphilum DSM 21637]
MEALTLGPLLLPVSRLPGLAALLVLLISTELLDKRHPGLARWGWLTLLVAALAGRLIYAAGAPGAYLSAPWTLLYFWQPGYSWWGALLGGLIFTGIYLHRHAPLRKIGGLSFAATAATGLLVLALLPGTQGKGDAIPDLRVFNLDGEELRLNQLADGRPLVVNLWATWCPPCRREMPMLMDFENDPRVQILLINQGESLLAVERYLDDQRLRFTLPLLDPEQNAMRRFEAPGLPATLFYSAEGQLVDRHFGELSRAQIEQFIRRQGRSLDK